MTLQYNHDIFEKFRELAITDPSQLVVGKTYYSNCLPRDKFVLVDVMTDQQYRINYNREVGRNVYSNKFVAACDNATPQWIKVILSSGFSDTRSLFDHNIGASYNPWLIFENEEDANRCIEELKVVYSDDPVADYDYDYAYDYEYEHEYEY